MAVAIAALALSPPITIYMMSKRDSGLVDQLSSTLLTFMRTHAGTGDSPAIAEKRLEVKRMELQAEREQRAIRAAELEVRAKGTFPGAGA